jgi:hypothetical protein
VSSSTTDARKCARTVESAFLARRLEADYLKGHSRARASDHRRSGGIAPMGEIVVASDEELDAARFSGKRLLALWNALTDVEMGPESRRPGGLSHRDGPERLPKLMFFRPAGLYGANLFTPVGGSAHHNLPRFTRLHSGWCAVERK